MTYTDPSAVFHFVDGLYCPTGLSRGPWRDDAQHGGAPAALLAHVAQAEAGPAFFLARLTFELTRPVPIAPLRVTATTGQGRTVRRIDLVVTHEDAPVARATALMIAKSQVDVPSAPDQRLTPEPQACTERFQTPGMPTGERFHDAAMEILVAHGSTQTPGPAAAWLRLCQPVVAGQHTTPAMRAAAAADFGNGLSWVLPFDRYMFANTDLTFYLHREPVGEWIGVDAATVAQDNGVGLASSTLYDRQGTIGMAHQNLLIRAR